MPKPEPQPDVLVLGEHPSAYLAAALLKLKSKLNVLHATIPGQQPPDRLVLLNPELFELNSILSGLGRKIDCRPVYGLQFLADFPPTRSEYRGKSAMADIACYSQVRSAMAAVAKKQQVQLINARQLQIRYLDEHGIDVTINGHEYRPKALVLAGRLDTAQERMLGLPESWEHGVLHRYTFAQMRRPRTDDTASRGATPMSLDLHGQLLPAWLLSTKTHMQLAVAQPMNTLRQHPPEQLLDHWLGVLARHGAIDPETKIPPDAIESLDLPFAGALAHEGVANRTLLIGPAGGFCSACGEDIYPNCWSAVFAADVMKKALKERHLQDALQPFRQKWRTTLGEYLRGPQQNLKFLLPLVYRNQVMTTRLAEAVLQGKNVVR